ncbi:DUF2520 domain-containing protein [Pedobacter sp. HMF7647]|uniref:DUF2520 domain-containing protein n=1 Tax=Hufsiella arboris TaxID=2695275 RepID=A0A7K1YAD7_9SPHI|nr:Rossmann-like and DUF2520 domain-containing protein [Hufsiella arboris]MXV51545.1 DUF2520 domain-containing protein [Hufsiella arboris]
MRISFIGSGNVATHLAAAFKNAGHQIVQVYSPTQANADILAYHVKAEAVYKLSDLSQQVDLIIISVKDDAIADVAKNLNTTRAIIVHTSGSTPLHVLNNNQQYGVFYPLQTLSKIKEVDMREVYLAVEASSDNVLNKLKGLAQDISNHVIELDSEKRLSLHVAAVFASNFTNHLYTLAKHVLTKNGLDFDLLIPLIREVADKVATFNPEDVQTGPAVRNDQAIIHKHMDFLKNDETLLAVYELLSQQIINLYHKD